MNIQVCTPSVLSKQENTKQLFFYQLSFFPHVDEQGEFQETGYSSPNSDFYAAFVWTLGFSTGESNAGTSLLIMHPLFITWSTEASAPCSPWSGPQFVMFYILCQREEEHSRRADEMLCRKCAFLRWGQSPQADEGCTLPRGSICVTHIVEVKMKYFSDYLFC